MGDGNNWTQAVITALLSVSAAVVVAYLTARKQLELTHEFDERRRIRETIGRYHGRLLAAAVALNHRMWNLYRNEGRNWMRMEDSGAQPQYYFHSTVHRFLTFYSLVDRFEAEAIILDARNSRPEDLNFLRFANVFKWTMTDAALFGGLPYDEGVVKDHFYADLLKEFCERAWKGDRVMTFLELKTDIANDKSGALAPVLRFFDGLRSEEDRLRWDRMVVLHLCLVAFINAFGYTHQRTSAEQVRGILYKIRNPVILKNLLEWLPRLGVAENAELLTLQSEIRNLASRDG